MATATEGNARTSSRPVVALLTGNAISYTGDIFYFIAIPWFVLQTTGSATKTGITAFFTTLPVVVAAFFGGTLVDRLGYKRTSILGDLASGSVVVLIPLLYGTVGLAFWQLQVIVFCGGLFNTPGATARTSLLPELAG